MSAGYKSTKAELVAIYRLEFYRKQKSWKFSKDATKEVARKKATDDKSILNQTYDVVVPNTNAEALALNDAFEDSGQSSNTDQPQDTSLKCSPNPNETEPALEPAPVEIPQTPKRKYQEPTLLEPDHKWSDLAHYWQEPKVLPEQTEDWLKTKMWSTAQIVWQRSSKRWSLRQEGLARKADYGELDMTPWVNVDYEGCEKGWPARSQEWTNAGQVMTEGHWDEDIPVESDGAEGRDEMEPCGTLQQQWAAHQAPTRGLPWAAALHEAWSRGVGVGVGVEADRSADSAREFMAGARAAPHSSELDLRLLGPRPPPPAARTTALQSRWSQSLEIHADPPQTLYDSSYEEYPTRDVGLYRPPSAQTLADSVHTADHFLAGSFMNHPGINVGGHTEGDLPPIWDSPCVGRGRGRLRKMDDHMVGLGRGRLHRF